MSDPNQTLRERYRELVDKLDSEIKQWRDMIADPKHRNSESGQMSEAVERLKEAIEAVWDFKKHIQ